jgi:Uma2 family endonuclease
MAASTPVLIPMETYLRTLDYEPDAEYVDGRIEARSAGEYDHNSVQQALLIRFQERRKLWQARAIQEQRTRVSPTRVRPPDVCVFKADFQIEQVLNKPPLICIEELSPEDRRSRMQEKIDDYRAFGVPTSGSLNRRPGAGGMPAHGSGRQPHDSR